MKIDGEALSRALGLDGPPSVHNQLCRSEIAAYEEAYGAGAALMVACTQEAPLFREIAEEAGGEPPVFVNIRERAGWCEKGRDATPKMAALLADAAYEPRPTGLITLKSEGVCLVYGAGEAALEAARLLAERLSVTLLLSDPGDVMPPSVANIPIYRGRIREAKGHLGAFEVTVDGYAPLIPSSRASAEFLMPRDGARSECDLILDLSGGTPLFTGWEKRDGYLRVDSGDPAAVARAAFRLADMVGAFEKPIYVGYDADICAHSRATKVGCTNCLDACPAGAIAPDGDGVAISAEICGGCGACSACCPTGAASYAFPGREDLVARMQALLAVYRDAGGSDPVLLFHDESHGGELIAAMARYGRGLPVNVLPVPLHSPGLLGHELLAAGLASGARRIVVLADPRKRAEYAPLEREITLLETILAGLGHDPAGRLILTDERDPDALEALLHGLAPLAPVAEARFAGSGSKRETARLAIGRLAEAGRMPAEPIALPQTAPYGRIKVDVAGCTLCLACVGACPADALLDNPDKPQLRFIEANCVQCGLCASTCPERVITLEARLDLSEAALRPAVIHEEEPALCIRCGRPFGTASTIARIRERLAGRHWMFRDEKAAELIAMCDDCRVKAQAERSDDPFALGPRPRIRTTDDDLAARAAGLSVDDFLKED